MSNAELLIFAKYPEAGAVMTRLCPPLSAEEAATIQRACIRLLCERSFRAWPVRPRLVISPDDSESRFREFTGPYVPMVPQGEGDLGARMLRAAKATLDEGGEDVLIIGSDSPTLPERLLVDARRGLSEADVVLGPCGDGGVYVVGLRAVRAEMFAGVEWSGERVAAQMRAGAETAGLTVTTIDTWYDIDRPADLSRALEDIRSGGAFDDFELRQVLEGVLDGVASRSAGAGS